MLWSYQYFRVQATTVLCKACERIFCEDIERFELGKFSEDLVGASEHADLYAAVKDLEYAKIFGDAEIVRTEAGGKRAIGGLLDIFSEELSKHSKLATTMPMPMTSELDITEDPDLSVRRVVDYVAGMTDRYAIDLYQELSGISL